MTPRSLFPLILATLAAVAFVLGLAASTAHAGPRTAECGKVASTTGSDSASGTLEAPYRTFQKLSDSLSPGQTGCLRAGTYHQSVTVRSGGTPSARVKIRSYPKERATLWGRLYVTDSADYVTLTHLNLDGSDSPTCAAGSTCQILPSPVTYGDHVTYSYDDITNQHTAICLNFGQNTTANRAEDVVIDHNTIHDCGRYPVTNHEHGMYLQRTDRATVTHNLIYDNADRGVQLYPDADDSYIAYNVIDGNGQGIIFGGDYGDASDRNLVEHNLITNSRTWAAYSWQPVGNPAGQGNVLRNNCLWSGGRQTLTTSHPGFTAYDNVFADPLYVNRAAHDYRLQPGSPCATLFSEPTLTQRILSLARLLLP